MRAALVGLLLFVGFIFVLTVVQRRRSRQLQRARRGEGFPEFAKSLPDVSQDIARKVYEYVQNNWASIKNFPVHAKDSIELYSDDEGLEEAIFGLVDACGKERPLLNVWAGDPIVTVGDLTRFIANLPTPEDATKEGGRRLWTNR